MSDDIVMPLHGYLSIPSGNPGFQGTSFTTMSSDPNIYYGQSGIYRSPYSSSFSFPLNSTRFSQAQAVYWYYKISGYSYDRFKIRTPHTLFLGKAFQDKVYEESSTYMSGIPQRLIDSSLGPNAKNLYGITPLFGTVPAAGSSFNYALYTDSYYHGFDLGAATLSTASEYVSYSDFNESSSGNYGISTFNPQTIVTFPDGSVETYTLDIQTGIRTMVREVEGQEPITEVEQTLLVTHIIARSDITTFPLATTSYFYDAYNRFTGSYTTENKFNAAVAADNAKGGTQYEVTPAIFPKKKQQTLSLDGALYYKTYDAFLTNGASHRIETI